MSLFLLEMKMFMCVLRIFCGILACNKKIEVILKNLNAVIGICKCLLMISSADYEARTHFSVPKRAYFIVVDKEYKFCRGIPREP